MNLLLSLGVSLAATLVIELSLAWLFKQRGMSLTVVTAVNLLTNPAIVLLWNLFHRFYWLMELTVVLLEGGCYRLFPKQFKKPVLFSLLLNFISCAIGIIMNGGIL